MRATYMRPKSGFKNNGHARLELSGPCVGLASSAPGFKSSQRLDCGKRTPLPQPLKKKKTMAKKKKKTMAKKTKLN